MTGEHNYLLFKLKALLPEVFSCFQLFGITYPLAKSLHVSLAQFCFVFGLLTNGFHTKFVSSFFFSIQKGWGLGGYSSFRLNKGRPNFLSQDHPPDK